MNHESENLGEHEKHEKTIDELLKKLKFKIVFGSDTYRQNFKDYVF